MIGLRKFKFNGDTSIYGLTVVHVTFLMCRQHVMEKAEEVLGSREIAERWFVRPAIGLVKSRDLHFFG